MDNRYSARSLSLRLGNRQIIHDVSLQLCGGGMTALIGPNGAGKSTLLRLLTGYLTPDGGERVVEGRPLESCRNAFPPAGGDAAAYPASRRLAG